MATYFTSDYHLGHANVIRFDGRPFKDVWEMDEAIIENHNSVVNEDDDFYFLGDFCFNNRASEYMSRLNGNKFFVKGNHDRRDMIKLYQKYGTYLGELAEVVVAGQKIILCHYSMRVWNKSHHGAWHLYGHSHHSLPDDPHSLSFDVGINGKGYDYKPLSFAQVGKIMAKKDWKPKDHHGKK